jgi:hypothetical protein
MFCTGKVKAKPVQPAPARAATAKKRKEGWLWTFGKMGKMSSEEMKAWSDEGAFRQKSVGTTNSGHGDSGDRVQWFRAEADMQRWEEQVEQKLAELRTTIRSFAGYKVVWTKLADTQDQDQLGRVAYAKQKAAMWEARENQARSALLGYPEYTHLERDDVDFLAFVEAQRAIHSEALKDILASARAAAGIAVAGDAPATEEGDWSDDQGDSDEDS